MATPAQPRSAASGRRTPRVPFEAPSDHQAADALNAASERAERLIAQLEGSMALAEARLAEAAREAERGIAVANELQRDAGSLIEALQGLASEVNSQVREHTAALMATMADAERPAEGEDRRHTAADISDEVGSLIEELRATALDITEDLDRKSGELRRLLDEAKRERVESPSRHHAPTPVAGRPVAAPKLKDEPLPGLRERAQAVRDEVQLTRTPTLRSGGRYAQAVELAAQGLSADDIARRCGLGREEVRMLLKLHGAGEKG